MNPANKALWYVETHFSGELTLDEIAANVGVSRFHLSHAFIAMTGKPLMRYVRGRRLTEAARALARGAPDILAVALEAGYGSHEAFTRAFREQFGQTPEDVRAEGHTENLDLLEPLAMDQTLAENVAPARFVNGKALLFVGMNQRYTCENSAGVPAQWQRFLPHFDKVPGKLNNKAYGVMYNFDDENNIDYLCGVEVADFSQVPAGWATLRVPEQKYAVFTHADHVSTIRRTWNSIWNSWLPSSGHEVVDAPRFELYGEDFDGRTGHGGLEIWIPVRA
jgi:AraC family transcriptional regulator